MKSSNKLLLLMAVLGSFFLAACGDGVSGNMYSDQYGHEVLEFKPDNKVSIHTGGGTIDGTYTVDGDKISIDGGSRMGKFVVTLESDGAISGMEGYGKLTAKS